MTAHWDDLPRERRDEGDMRAWLTGLGGQDLPAGAVRAQVDPRSRHMPFHLHHAEEELFYVERGDGVVVIGDAAHEVRAGDAVLRPPRDAAHAFVAGDEGMDLLCFGENLDLPAVELPRAGIVRRGAVWWELGTGAAAREREVAAGPLEVPAVRPRPSCVVHVPDLAADTEFPDGYAGEDRDAGSALGSVRTGLRHDRLAPGSRSTPPHWHGAETELFVVLGGSGEVEWWDLEGRRTSADPLRRGSVVVRPPGTGVAHSLLAGDDGLEYLAYGTRVQGELVHYPRSSKALLGPLLVRLEPVEDPWEGEVEPLDD